jgi:hypothetical protein
MGSMKTHTEMTEGPRAFENFKNAMKAIVIVPKAAILIAEKKAKKKRESRASSRARAAKK